MTCGQELLSTLRWLGGVGLARYGAMLLGGSGGFAVILFVALSAAVARCHGRRG